MKNLWIQTEHAFVTWVVDLTEVKNDPYALLSFLEKVLDAGSRHEIFTVLKAPEINFERDRDTELYDFLNDIFQARKVVDLFAFTGAAMAPGTPLSSTVQAKVAWFDANSKCTENLCSDLATVLQSLEPVEGSIPSGFMKHLPPIRITGLRLTYYDDASESSNYSTDHAVMIYFAIHSDIWFPWIYGSAHPLCDHKHMFDNRELALKHTPRLNDFLQEVSTFVTQIGGTWNINILETGKDVINWLDSKGFIDLTPQMPELVMPESAYEAEWF